MDNAGCPYDEEKKMLKRTAFIALLTAGLIASCTATPSPVATPVATPVAPPRATQSATAQTAALQRPVLIEFYSTI